MMKSLLQNILIMNCHRKLNGRVCFEKLKSKLVSVHLIKKEVYSTFNLSKYILLHYETYFCSHVKTSDLSLFSQKLSGSIETCVSTRCRLA